MNTIRAGTLFGMITSSSSDLYSHWAIRSFFKHTTLGPRDLFVLIDNDNIWPENPSAFINLIKNPKPQTFSQNVNLLISIADQKNLDLVLLNNDIILTSNWLEPLEKLNDIIAIPSCNQTHEYSHGGLVLQSNMNLESYRGKESALEEIVQIHKSDVNYETFEKLLMPMYVFRLPKEIYRKIGYFDTGYLGGGEDIDYRVRALISGVNFKYVSTSYVLHFNGISTWRSGEDISKVEERNRQYKEHFSKKWGNDLMKLLMPGEDPNSVLIKYDLMHFNDQVHSYNDLIQTIWKLSNTLEAK